MKLNINFSDFDHNVLTEQNKSIISLLKDENNLTPYSKIIKKKYKKYGKSLKYSSYKEEFLNEVYYLQFLQKYNFVPRIIKIDYDSNEIYLNYCGELITEENLPLDWKKQMQIILKVLENHGLYHNDFHYKNLLVNNNRFYLIDYSFMDVKEDFPYINITLQDFNKYLYNEDYNCFTNLLKDKSLISFKRAKKQLNITNDLYSSKINIINYSEELNSCNYHREPEFFTIIIWDGIFDMDKTNEYLSTLNYNFTIVLKRLIKLTKDQQSLLMNSIYFSDKVNRVVNNTIYLVILKDYIPIYEECKATSCIQVLNKNMYKIKKDLRVLLGNSEKAYLKVHTSYNVEESLMVLNPLGLSHYVPRQKFKNLKDFFTKLNNHSTLKYIVQRSFEDLNSIDNLANNKDIDILTNDYYLFKNLTGARSNNTKFMRDNDNGFYIQNNVIIDNKKIMIDIRYVGDEYLHSKWECNMLENRQLEKINDFWIYKPNNKDLLHSLLYLVLVQKHNNPNIKHYSTIFKLLSVEKKNKFKTIENYINSKKGALTDLKNFLLINNYGILNKPKDTNVGFYVKELLSV